MTFATVSGFLPYYGLFDNNTLNSLKLELAKLAVDVTDYYTNDIDEEYNSNKLLDLQNKLKDLDNLEKQLNNIELDLKNENDKLR